MSLGIPGVPVTDAPTMEAWQSTGTDVPEMTAAGLCHSDVSLMEYPARPDNVAGYPFTMRHENAGVGVEKLRNGEVVGRPVASSE